MRVAIIGAGNVGAMTASRIIDANLADVILMDIVPHLAKGKALDISDARPILGSKAKITGTENFEDIQGAEIVVITAGLARKPGMTRDDLLKKNSQILRDISTRIKKICSYSIVIVVTNPLDAMSYLAMQATGSEPRRVIGMAGVLDSARFINIASEKSVPINAKEIFMMGSHDDTMVAINRSKNISQAVFQESRELTAHRGREIVSYLKTGNAYFSPSAAVFYMVKSILKDEKRRMCVSAYLQGQYGEKDIYMGVPVVLGASGVIEIIEIELTKEEREAFKKAAQKIRESIKKLKV